MIFEALNAKAVKSLINATVQPIRTAVEGLSRLNHYWWRRRTYTGGYYEKRTDAWKGNTYNHVSGSTGYYQYIDVYREDGEHDTNTLTIASSISVNSATGAITMVNPTTVTVNYSSYTQAQLEELLSGKYVKGLLPSPDTVRFVQTGSRILRHAWVNGDTTVYEVGFEKSEWSGTSGTLMNISSAYSATTGTWEYVSGETAAAYPDSGVSNGWQYQAMGSTIDMILAAKAATMNNP